MANQDTTSLRTIAVSDVILLVSEPKNSGTMVVLPADKANATAPMTLSWNTVSPRRFFLLRRAPPNPIWSESVRAPLLGIAFHMSSYCDFFRASHWHVHLTHALRTYAFTTCDFFLATFPHATAASRTSHAI